ncbi:O-antigen ligase family protein [Flavobacterium johnsoniae]|uniref:O-antigen polymerase n=1 Tax=Flavobacterium johnsoniae (strain ATCC 17061 / DSM 2064 / JCM 8514 / BCRC 14874 / CCUG 350202 / NBRC 14942 / NCIMB 11054 / UW101) TaxID=376686 RepID=A5FG38_FLAJ1|nr:O-antigen ligase family protein [Flavobacterium johnsoniae]ABQ05835.1 O-antigen polymerase [Flavobacterium johnsoniae UW101]OXG01074.1 hypothetical protein B0A63_06105 [Flavobacterium johnsoniae UW101]WQG81571.1 O-antigen ligase family protein [Flavobacterium johnsoniae UW101]SHK57438.1 O-antigen ligase [Flavobacterium johnsoniae]
MSTAKIDRIINETKEKKKISNFVTLSFIVSLLIIDFLPYFKSLEIINPQFLYLSVINLIFGIYFYFNTNVLSNTVFSLLKRSYIFRLYLAFILLCGISLFSAKNSSLVFTKFTEIAIVFCLFINLTILLKDKFDLLYKIVLIIGISAFFQSLQQLQNFLIIPKNTSIMDLLWSMKGNTGNINILAASLTIKIPFLLLGITHFNSYKKIFFTVTLFSVVSVIFLTGARTPLINLFLIFFIYIVYLLKENTFSKPGFIKIIYLIVPVLCAVLYTNSIFEKSKDNNRYVALENRIERINAEDNSSKARLTFWGNAFEMIKKNPILGIGLGNYQIESIPYEKTTSYDLIVSLHAHNDFIEISAETGIINGLIYLSIFILIFSINLKNVLKSNDSHTRLTALLTLMLVIVYGVDSLFNFPMYRPTMSIFFSLILAFTVLNNFKDKNLQQTSNKTIKIIAVTLIVVSLITSYSAFLIYRASNLEYLIVTDNINVNTKGALNGDEVMRRMPAYPNVFNTSESFYEYAGIYYIREKNYSMALKCFSRASKINPYLGRIDFYKHVISNEKGNIDSAYIYVKKAFYRYPVNYGIYSISAAMAAKMKDTTEILKEHALFSKYRNHPEELNLTLSNLKTAGYNYKSQLNFINKSLIKSPADSTLLKKKKDLLVTDYLVKGQSFESQSKLDKALEYYEKALKTDPNSPYPLQNIGFYYYKAGQDKKAISYLLNALKYPGLYDGKTEFFIGICYLREQDKANACKYFNIAKNKKYSQVNQSILQSCK